MNRHNTNRAWQRMLSGRRLDLLDPSPVDVEIIDIAHGLARVARWNGQTHGSHAFSVAQHCVLVEQIYGLLEPDAGARNQLLALLHDGPEYVIGDMISPFKAVIGDSYREVEARLQTAIHLRFALPGATPRAVKAQIKRADQIAAFFEATLLAGFNDGEAAKFFGRPSGLTASMFDFEPWPTELAQSRFLARFTAIESERSTSP
jgi:5'-deoxynucleotidase YfbR-like HD superfamily hydrolase